MGARQVVIRVKTHIERTPSKSRDFMNGAANTIFIIM